MGGVVGGTFTHFLALGERFLPPHNSNEQYKIILTEVGKILPQELLVMTF